MTITVCLYMVFFIINSMNKKYSFHFICLPLALKKIGNRAAYYYTEQKRKRHMRMMLCKFYFMYKLREAFTDLTTTVKLKIQYIDKARVFSFFVLQTLPTQFFLKLKKIRVFSFIFLFPSDSCQYSTGVQLCFFVLSFLLMPGWLNYPQCQHLVRYCHFNW